MLKMMSNEITINDIYRMVNIPTMLILPGFCNILEKEPLNLRKGGEIPLLMLLYEYGFIESLIQLDSKQITPVAENIILKFTDEVIEDKGIIDSDHASLSTRLINYPYFIESWSAGETIYFKYKIPDNLQEDINNIIDSRYTKVSEKFMRLSATNSKYIPKKQMNIGYFLLKHNVAIAVFKQHKTLKEIVEEGLGVRIPANVDFARKFNFERDAYLL